ncbi:MAG: hypothetical protein OXG15_15225 [Gammaproteobacteria bacterium]|nr:hypothetical protein [Gammaproteobacteria bacterium]
MNEQNFETLLDLHGSNLSAWPENLRAEANVLLAQSALARALLNAQIDVDKHLVDVMVVPQTYGLEQKVMSRFAAHKRRSETGFWRGLIWNPALAAACSLAFGFYLGAANQELPVDLAEDLTYMTFYDYESWSGDVDDES